MYRRFQISKRSATKFRGVCERLQRGAAVETGATGKAGYLYILTNPSLGNMIKVAKTKRNPRERINESPQLLGFQPRSALAFDAYVEDCDAAEAYVHACLEQDGYRVAKNREFFNVDLATAVALILEAQRAVSTVGPQQSSQKN